MICVQLTAYTRHQKRCRISVEPPSAALVQHRPNNGLKSRVCRSIIIFITIVSLKAMRATYSNYIIQNIIGLSRVCLALVSEANIRCPRSRLPRPAVVTSPIFCWGHLIESHQWQHNVIITTHMHVYRNLAIIKAFMTASMCIGVCRLSSSDIYPILSYLWRKSFLPQKTFFFPRKLVLPHMW